MSRKLAHIRGPGSSSSASSLYSSFQDALCQAAEIYPERGISVFDRSGRRAARRSYPELLVGIRAAVGRWRALGVKPGDRILLCLPTSWDFFDAWLGAVCLGAHPAAIAPAVGGLGASSVFAERLRTFCKVISATRILTSERLVEDLRENSVARSFSPRPCESDHAMRSRAEAPRYEIPSVVAPSELSALDPLDDAFAASSPSDLAFLQFTSGSTGTPRAVRVTHQMAIRNVLAINEAIGRPHGAPANQWIDEIVSWLPMHHDMGLIGCLTMSIVNGLELSLMNPATFLARPLRYLQALSGKRAIMSGPNFGYQYCVDRLSSDDLQGVDLSQVAVAVTGSEMVRPETMHAFCQLMEPTGFTKDKTLPCYGMAEATLAVTFDCQAKGVRTQATPASSSAFTESAEVTCCGMAVEDTEVRIVGPSGDTLNEGELGEILVKGPAVFDAYYENEYATGEAKEGEWLKTGDLGFIADGELYIAGRCKEIIVLRGENIMPHEIEWLAEEAAPGQAGERVAAFSIHGDEGIEKVVLVAEVSDPAAIEQRERAMRRRIGRALSLPISDLVFVRRGQIPRTSSGKLQRGKLKQAYLENRLSRLAHAPGESANLSS